MNERKVMKLIISDFFGVVIDEDGPSYFKNYLNEPNHEIADKFFTHGDSGEMNMDEVIHMIATHYSVDETFLHNYIYNHPSFHKEYAEELRKKKKEGFKVVLLSNAPEGIVEYFIKKFHAEDLFEKLYISYATKKLKPHADAFQMVLNDYHVKPEEAVFIDDNKKNVDAASRLGLNIIQYQEEKDVVTQVEALK